MGSVFLVAHQRGLLAALARAIQDQGDDAISVVGATSWEPGELAAIGAARPDVVVLATGFAAGDELRAIAEIRRLAPGCRVLVADTLGDANACEGGGWGQADALLRSEQLATELVPLIRRLAAGGSAREGLPSEEQKMTRERRRGGPGPAAGAPAEGPAQGPHP